MTEDGPEKALHWYGRRRGKRLRPGRQALMEDLLPRLRVAPPTNGGVLDLERAFGRCYRETWLEVGFGAGEHLAGQAVRHPDVGFIGCEPFVNGVAALLARIEAEGLTNVRIFDDDARRLLPALDDGAVGRMFVLFADPWPKTRHHKRRLIGPETLGVLSRVLADGAELRLASDHAGYIAWTLEHVTRHPDFHWPARAPGDWRHPPADWIETRYERKARADGVRPAYLRFLRRPRSAVPAESR